MGSSLTLYLFGNVGDKFTVTQLIIFALYNDFRT